MPTCQYVFTSGFWDEILRQGFSLFEILMVSELEAGHGKKTHYGFRPSLGLESNHERRIISLQLLISFLHQFQGFSSAC